MTHYHLLKKSSTSTKKAVIRNIKSKTLNASKAKHQSNKIELEHIAMQII